MNRKVFSYRQTQNAALTIKKKVDENKESVSSDSIIDSSHQTLASRLILIITINLISH